MSESNNHTQANYNHRITFIIVSTFGEKKFNRDIEYGLDSSNLI